MTVPCVDGDVRALDTDPTQRLYRNNVVQGEGPTQAAVMLIGEAPGFQEDAQSRPFVPTAPAGRVLAQAMAETGFCRVVFSDVEGLICTTHGAIRGASLLDGPPHPAFSPMGSTRGGSVGRAALGPSSLSDTVLGQRGPLVSASDLLPTRIAPDARLLQPSESTSSHQTPDVASQAGARLSHERQFEGRTLETSGEGASSGISFPRRQKILLGTQTWSIPLDVGCILPYMTNTVHCRPEDNKLSRFPDGLEICRSTFQTNEIAAVQPKVIVCLGKTAALPWFGKQGSLAFRWLAPTWDRYLGMNNDEVVTGGPEVLVIHAPHPSFVARTGNQASPAYGQLVDAMRVAMRVGYPTS